MLRGDEATKRLEAFQVANHDRKLLRALKPLPPALGNLGRTLLDVDSQGKRFGSWQKREAAQKVALRALETLSAKDRQRLFAALFAGLAGHVENAWKLFDRIPYTAGHSRRAFRVPGDDAAQASNRYTFLANLAIALKGYEPDIAWCAAWAPHVGGHWSSSETFGLLFAAAIDAGGAEGEEVFEILKQSATNEHEIGRMGRHVTRALLACGNPDAWAFMERLLLAAQRQEGLRQVILETIDEAHPEAFGRMLRLILDQNLLRFSATVRAVDVWFGLQWSALTPAVLRKTIEQVVRLYEDEAARNEALKSATGEGYYFALWCLAYRDAHAARKQAAAVHKDEDVERRFVAAHFLMQLGLPQAQADMLKFFDDEDLRVALRVADSLEEKPERFADYVRLLDRMPAKPRMLEPIVWPWQTLHAYPTQVADRLSKCLGKRPATDLLPYLSRMSSYGKRQAIGKLKAIKRWDAATRDLLLSMLADRDAWVRREAGEALAKCTLEAGEAEKLEGYLGSKNSDLRRGIVAVLGKQKTPEALATADRLLAAKKVEPRTGGLELLRLLVDGKRALKEARQRVADYRAKYAELSDQELSPLEAVENYGKPLPTLDDALGLMDPSQRTKPVAPEPRKTAFVSKAALECLKSLDALIQANKETVVTYPTSEGPRDGLLGNVTVWQLPSPDPKKPETLVQRELWEKWYAERPKGQRDADGCELLRALAWVHATAKERAGQVSGENKVWKPFYDYVYGGLGPIDLKTGGLVNYLVRWLVGLHPPAKAAAYYLDTMETMFALVPKKVVTLVLPANASWDQMRKDWRGYYGAGSTWYQMQVNNRYLTLSQWTDKDRVRLWQLLHWRDQPAPNVSRSRPQLDETLVAFRLGGATEADVLDQVLGPHQSMVDFSRLTMKVPHEEAAKDPRLAALVERCVTRVLEVELGRGENPTAATAAARAIEAVHGLAYLQRFVTAIGKRPFRQVNSQGRAETFTKLVSATYPTAADTPEAFAAWVKAAKIDEGRLLQLAFLAPQWSPHVEKTLGWAGLREGVWWLVAHAQNWEKAAYGCDDALSPGFEVEKAWTKLLRERTALTPEERREGLIDPAWFNKVYAALGRKKWDALAQAAKVCLPSSDLRKARYAADTLLGRVKKGELVKKIREKNSREGVRLLGLLPLARGDRRDDDLQGRYRVFMAYRRYARSLSPMGQEGALRDLEIGLSNLARTAGYPDPVRLGWAMEARELADLAQGPVEVAHQGLTVSLALGENQQPVLTVKRGEKVLKAIPPAARKHKKIAALTARQAEVKRQGSRVKQSLEAMMVRGDVFSGQELRDLFAHPLLRPLLERLVIVGEGILGYPVAEGKALENHAGKKEPVKLTEQLRLAHPHDLFTAGDWEKWQRHCFTSEKVQPFKQVFRELYVVSKQEKADGNVSHRYAGQQVQPRQSMALWGGRGWNTRDEVTKTFHDAGIVAEVTFKHHGWTAAEVEGHTLEGICFRKQGEWELLKLTDVPPRLFSEVMRDGDLVVSVAHVGGVDPEASASTVQMREALVKETCALLKIDNYRLAKSHIILDGQLGTYSVHLGSGVVHRQPGGHVCIVPVHAQHRGRLFLPFADDDPRTAEIISKVLLLARDHEIQDPTILEQLR